ncbi:MAG: hypothetical protein K8S21_08400 [Gemmatimonadetes bacterium]|nr:hypothetical protein [Gemmatimonadota bacterium]
MSFTGLRDRGKGVALAERHQVEGADEITSRDLTATREARVASPVLEVAA